MIRVILALLCFLLFVGVCANYMITGKPLFQTLGWVEPTKYVQHQYPVGAKVLLKTGDQAVIVEHVKTPYYEGNPIPSAGYNVRVGYAKKVTDNWFAGKQTTDIGRFFVREFEIEKRAD